MSKKDNVLTIELPNFQRQPFEAVLSFIFFNDPSKGDEAIKQLVESSVQDNQLMKVFVNVINNLYLLRGFSYEDIYIDKSNQKQNIYYIYSKKADKQGQYIITLYHLTQAFSESYLNKIDKTYTSKGDNIIYFLSPKWINKQPKNVIQLQFKYFLRNIIENNFISLPEIRDSIELYKGIKETKFPRIFVDDPMVQFLNGHKGQFIMVKIVQNIGSNVITTEIRRIIGHDEDYNNTDDDGTTTVNQTQYERSGDESKEPSEENSQENSQSEDSIQDGSSEEDE